MATPIPDLTDEDFIAFEREACKRSLSYFIQRAWRVIEPSQPYVHGWHIDAMAEHLEAVTAEQIVRLYIAVPPGMMKSLMVGVFWPAWEWGPRGLASYRYLGTSHALHLAIRDNIRTRRLIQSEWYQRLWPVTLVGDQNEKMKFENDKTGFREAMAFGGLTGSRGDRILGDDVMSVLDSKSPAKRKAVKEAFLEEVPTRINNAERSAIVIIQQRLHTEDPIGLAQAMNLGYEGLVLPMEFEPDRRCHTSIGFSDPRTEPNELLFAGRFPREVVDRDKVPLGSYGVASQFQQRPVPREGGTFHRTWFEIVDAIPAGCRWVRGWDLAATAASPGSNAAYTAGVKIGRHVSGVFYIADVVRGRWSPGVVERTLKNTTTDDGYEVIVDLPQDPGQAGKFQVRYFVTKLAGYTVKFNPETGSKEARADPLASQAEAGNVKLLRAPWNEAFLDEIELFPNSDFKDQVDAASRAFARLIPTVVNASFAPPLVITG